MCLAIPARVCEINEADQAIVDLGGVRKECSLALVDGVEVGDYVILHVGYALTRLDPEEAAKTLALMAEAGVVAARDGGHIGNAGAVSDLAARDGGHIGNAGAVSDLAARDGGHIGNAGAVSDLAARDGGHIGNAGAVSDMAPEA